MLYIEDKICKLEWGLHNSMPRSRKIIPFIVATPFILIAGAFILLYVGDDLRFASIKHYSSELTLLPDSATLDVSSQNSNSSFGDGGMASGLYIYREYTLKSSVSPQTVYSYYHSQLASRGWTEDAAQTRLSPENDSEDFTWQRAGTHNDTLSYSVTYKYGGAAQTGTQYANLLELQIESDPNGNFNIVKNIF